MKKLFLIVPMIFLSATAYADCDAEIAFEEQVNEAENCRHGRCLGPFPGFTDEEERMLHERTDASWAGKREDTLLDEILHE